MRHRHVAGRAARGPGELGRVPLEHLPLGVDVGVHWVVVDPDGGEELLAGGAEAADQRGVLIREVNAIVEVKVGVGVRFSGRSG